jgi:hypothetical protein
MIVLLLLCLDGDPGQVKLYTINGVAPHSCVSD